MEISPNTWTEITTADVASLTVQNVGVSTVIIKGTTGAAPANEDGALHLPTYAILVNETLADLFPGQTGAVRVWAKSTGTGRLVVSHA